MRPYPLQWPPSQPRTSSRLSSYRFRTASGMPTGAQALNDLYDELGRMGIVEQDVVVSTNWLLRGDGYPRASQREPEDPGVAVWFERAGATRCIAVDAFDQIVGNIRAITLAVEAIRRLDRYGISHALLTSAADALLALPERAGEGVRPWHEVLGVDPAASEDVVNAAYRALAKVHHPDAGGSRAEWDELQRAYREWSAS